MSDKPIIIQKRPYIYKAKVLRVVDGDTYDFLVWLEEREEDLGFKITLTTIVKQEQRHRLREVDTWETYRQKRDSEHYKKGVAATEAVKQWFEDAADGDGFVLIETVKDRSGKYGRYLVNAYKMDKSENLVDFLKGSEHEKVK